MPQRFITDCMNTLVFRKEVIKVQQQVMIGDCLDLVVFNHFLYKKLGRIC